MKTVLDAAGIRNYSIWNINEILFAYYEIVDTQMSAKNLSESIVYENWRKEMEEYIDIDISGQKKWPMENVFLTYSFWRWK